MNVEAVYWFLLVESLVVSYLDLQYKLISNKWIIVNLLLIPFFYFYYFLFYPLHISTFVYPFGILAVGFFLFWLGVMGAGDVKYLTSFYLLIPPSNHADFTLSLMSITLMVTLVLFLWKLAARFKSIVTAFRDGNYHVLNGIIFSGKNVYAPIIFLSWLYQGLIWFKWI